MISFNSQNSCVPSVCKCLHYSDLQASHPNLKEVASLAQCHSLKMFDLGFEPGVVGVDSSDSDVEHMGRSKIHVC